MRKTPTPPKMKAPTRCLGRTAARTPQTAKMVLIRGFASLLQPYMANPATPDRRRRILRTIVLPAPDPTPTEDRKGG